MPGNQDQTPLSIGGERSEEQEQQAFLRTASEIPPRTELVQQFISQIARWQDDIEAHYERLEDQLRGRALHVYQTEAGYTVEAPTESTPQDYLLLSTFEDSSYSGHRFYVVHFMHINDSLSEEPHHVGFIDPYNNRRMFDLRIGLIYTPYAERRRQLLISARYVEKGFEEDERIVFHESAKKKGRRNKTSEINIAVHTGIPIHDFYAPDATLLSGDIDTHAKALMDFTDSLIPRASPPLPEPTREGGQ